MITTFFLPVLFAVSFSIQQQMEEHSAIQLLTQKTWTLMSYGFDHNHNNTIDTPEECITDCTKDDTYDFSADGTGFYSDNVLSCCTGIAELPFRWKFTKTRIAIDFSPGAAEVFALTDEQLVLVTIVKTGNRQLTRLIKVFRH